MTDPATHSDQHSLNKSYIGRFAPSPTGPLHFGSLMAAVASFLDARFQQGQWLIRMEDLDPPREPPGTAELILQQLQDFGLKWDGDVLFQSSRLEKYQGLLEKLQQDGLCFPCDCTRPQIKMMGNVYDGSCLSRASPPLTNYGIRVRVEDKLISFQDLIQGEYAQNLKQDIGDFTILRKDGLFAYQLAVVADDDYQQVSHVIRGIDLLDSTPRQIHLQSKLGFPEPIYGHIPIVVNSSGQKLSKQHFAPSVNTEDANKLLVKSLRFLGQNPAKELMLESPATILKWGIENWDIQAVPKLATIPEDIAK
ncbi:MAG: tRNA glutamyl-Q(34) synthetase GluQRS [Gammaproteobacteria bacterium]|jgi:glutamyl-Q tRNA(Asp) synthetase|nr:tRNA glutamyl-Q(34) synthetase GluQRS [Gammaproteobacteria bacterium]MBT3859894.1 tRNA glutamyl-Q(34) synthetase GluQRS [Gammaproteobacteria bacterium]MBT3986356.1 tRNA glutamyl-Q(34) synthetase GluQRS [Gammaproteobacteria bacterium]MBT4254689.1 tRNA glutamyl-Q(34) synthetase GluQRS [Gammaproteobacteria bacterium]MBT4582916.1 tRNA glutamyl-Q(34) synthetase GluQRS [Gammaproteobacteria bacterium]